jgi:DNA-binding CsgD family transcriptional regulator
MKNSKAIPAPIELRQKGGLTPEFHSNHRDHLLKKFGVHSVVSLIVQAVLSGLLDL